jgi:hypothetical protein
VSLGVAVREGGSMGDQERRVGRSGGGEVKRQREEMTADGRYSIYEFIQRRSDWKKIEKTVDKVGRLCVDGGVSADASRPCMPSRSRRIAWSCDVAGCGCFKSGCAFGCRWEGLLCSSGLGS